MSAALRKALFWIVMLALPLHGIASTMMPLHATGGQTVQTQQAFGHMDSDMADASATVQHESKDCAGKLPGCDFSHHAMVKCVVSGACAFVAAPGSALTSFVRSRPADAPPTLQTNVRIAFFTGAPERPPRFPA